MCLPSWSSQTGSLLYSQQPIFLHKGDFHTDNNSLLLPSDV